LKLINISKKYEYVLFNNINYEFQKGKIYSIFGKNGIGKTTLLNILSGFISQDNGNIDYGEFGNNIMFIGENAIPFELLTGKEFIFTTLDFKGIDMVESEINQLFKNFEMENFINKIIATYSKGMKYKLLIILIILIKPKILVLDEPLIDVDFITLETVANIFSIIKEQSIIILSTHVANIAFKLSDKILYLTPNELIEVDNHFENSEEINNYIYCLMKNGTNNNLEKGL
jgi:ABC-2 type transport system ATP-binding protein